MHFKKLAIAYLPYKSIDKKKWDNCIVSADNCLIYATSFYLDAMSENWDALVLDDYKAVMPLTWKKKYSIHYLYQPFFVACLGVFGKKNTAGIVDSFLNAIPAKFKYWDIYLNHGNFFQLQHFKLYERKNYVLPLQKAYESLYESFRDNIKRNIKKAEKLNCIIKKDFAVDDVIKLAAWQSKDFSSLTNNDFNRFKKIYTQLHKNKQAVTYGVYTSLNELVASCVFFLF